MGGRYSKLVYTTPLAPSMSNWFLIEKSVSKSMRTDTYQCIDDERSPEIIYPEQLM